MKVIFSIILALTVSQFSYADDSENKVFSGVFTVESCSPSCDQVSVGGGAYTSNFSFSKIEGMTISIEDTLPKFWLTCDGSSQAYEFNVWTYGKNESGVGYQTGHFMNNNLEADSANPWRNVCDGKFSSSSSMISLVSPNISLKLKRITDENFELSWSDKRWGISGTFTLRKNQ